ncbi:hypothetical protein, partial [Acetivibrio mesophilus]|uniref:hypothetical protein n=1 Tax=Acetivibrio mesophilus TaxID=2487273 RepID=UPI0019D43E17
HFQRNLRVGFYCVHKSKNHDTYLKPNIEFSRCIEIINLRSLSELKQNKGVLIQKTCPMLLEWGVQYDL